MSENTATTDSQVSLDAKPAPLTFKLNPAEVVEQLRGYYNQAEQSLANLQNNIDAGNRQLDEWKRMQLMIVGQKQVVADLLNKIVEAPQAESPAVK
jgi:hypothetical protein